jgi:hypothetical protein
VHLSGGVGHEGDRHERHADAVAERVVAGRSSEDLLDEYAPGRSPAGGGSAAVQRYAKHGNTRVSDGKDLVVVDEGTHHRAFATPEKLEDAKAGLQEGSHIELAAGGKIDAVALGLAGDAANAECVEVKVSQKASDTETRQREGAQAVSGAYVTTAEAEMQKLAKPSLWQKLRGTGPDVDLTGFDPERDILGDPQIKAKITEVYTAIAAKARDFSPDNVARVAAAKGLPQKVIYYLMSKMREYHQLVLDEYQREGGFTTPNDCGETAKNFVRGREVAATVGGGEGYPYHFFSMLLRDGGDRVALENAVGGNHLEQLWKQGAFDASWHWEMRGTERPLDERGDGHEEAHGVGEAKTPPSSGFRGRQMASRLDLQDTLKDRS